MSGKAASSSKWTLSQLWKRNRTNPAWNDLARVMRASSEEFGLVGKRSDNYETAITQVMNHFDALKPLMKDEATRLKVGDIMIHNAQSRLWLKRKRIKEAKILNRNNKLWQNKNKKKGHGGKALNKREKDESNSESQVKVKHDLKKSTTTPVSSGSQPTSSPGMNSQLSEDAQKLLVLHRPLSTWKRLMALMRMTSENLGIDGLQDDKSLVAIAGIMANFRELRPHMDNVHIQKKIRRQMITNLTQRIYLEKKKESLHCPPKTKMTEKKQKPKKEILKIKTFKMTAKGKKDKRKHAKKELSTSIEALLPSVSATKNLQSTQLISELSVKARQLLFYRHPRYSYQRLRKMMRQTGDRLGLDGLRSPEGLAEIIQIMEGFPQLQPYLNNVHVLKKIQSQMIMNFHQRSRNKRNKMKSQTKAKESTETVSEDNLEECTSDPEEDEKKTNNSIIQASVPESKQQLTETEVEKDTAMAENDEEAPLTEDEDRSKVEKDETFETEKEKEKCVSENEKKIQDTEEENLSVEETGDMDAEREDDQTTSDKEETPVIENKIGVTSPENGECGQSTGNETDLTEKDPEKDADKTGNKDNTATDKEETFEPESDSENVPPTTENKDVPVTDEKTDPVAAESQPPLQTCSQRLLVGKSTMKMSEEAKQLLVHHRPYATWKQLRDAMRTIADELGLEALREPAALKSVKHIMKQFPQLEPYSNVALLQQRLQKQMVNNLYQRIWDHKRRYVGTYQPKEGALSSVTRWRQTRLFPVKRKNLKDITENNKVMRQSQVDENSDSSGSGKCWCQKGRAASWTHNDILHRASGSLPWRHLMNIMKVTSSALNVNKKSSENYQTAVLEVMNHFPGLKKVADNVSIQSEIGKRMIKNEDQRRRQEMRRTRSNSNKVSLTVVKKGKPSTLKAKEKFLKRMGAEKKKQTVKSDDLKADSENSENVEKRQSKKIEGNTKKCWCQKKAAATWTYNDILVKTMGNVAWKHFTKIMHLTARNNNITKRASAKYNSGVTAVMNHFPALRPFVHDMSVRQEIGKKMIRNYYRLSKRHQIKFPNKEAENSTTEKEQQDMESNDQEPDSENSENVEKRQSKTIQGNTKRCWCQKKGAATWTYNDILVKTTGNIAWKHFTKLMQFTARDYNITKLTSANYETGVTKVINHFPALRPFIDDESVRREIGMKMIKNYIRLSKRLQVKSPNKEAENSTTEKEQQDMECNDQEPVTETTKRSDKCEAKEVSSSNPVKKRGVKKCWCQKGESSTWTYNDLLVRTPGNEAWKHFIKIVQDTSEALNVTKRSSVNYQTAVTEIMNHFPALRPLVNDDSVQQQIGDKMVKNYYERMRQRIMREKMRSEAAEGLDSTTEKTDVKRDGQKPGKCVFI